MRSPARDVHMLFEFRYLHLSTHIFRNPALRIVAFIFLLVSTTGCLCSFGMGNVREDMANVFFI